MRTLRSILEVYEPKSGDEKKFVAKHVTIKHSDPAGNGDDVYQAKSVKAVDREKERKGFTRKSGESVYEATQIAEISKKTLGSYVKKAAIDMTNRTADATKKRTLAGADYAHNISRGMSVKTAEKHMKADYDDAKPDTKKSIKRMYGIDKAVARLTKESVKPEVEKAFPASGVTKHAPVKGVNYMPKDKEKEKANSMKYGRQVKEEVEELDELSKGTLASYAKKATHDARIKQSIGKDFEKDRSRKPDMKAAAASLASQYKSKSRSREAGIGKAIDRLAKEEVELAEGYEKVVLDYLDQHGVDGMFRSGNVIVNKSDVAKARMLLKKAQDFDARDLKVIGEEVETNEVLKPSMGAGEYIKDFQKSDDPRFKDASKKERTQRALAAYYAAKRKEG